MLPLSLDPVFSSFPPLGVASTASITNRIRYTAKSFDIFVEETNGFQAKFKLGFQKRFSRRKNVLCHCRTDRFWTQIFDYLNRVFRFAKWFPVLKVAFESSTLTFVRICREKSFWFKLEWNLYWSFASWLYIWQQYIWEKKVLDRIEQIVYSILQIYSIDYVLICQT